MTSEDRQQANGRTGAGRWIAGLGLVVIGVLVGAGLLVWAVSIVHGWWPFVPRMPYWPALALMAVATVAVVVGKVLGMLTAGLFGHDADERGLLSDADNPAHKRL